MTREEAKEILTHNWTRVDNPNYSESELDEAFFMAIEALQREDRFLKSMDTNEPLYTEVVRCKDCKWYGTTDCQIQESFYGIKDFDFCSYGERKGGDDE